MESFRGADRDRLANVPAAPGLYVHIPFCVSRCDYCAFATWEGMEDRVESYMDAVISELRAKRSEDRSVVPGSIYFGGGTPSFIPARHIARVVEEAGTQAGTEVTVECNPESTDIEKLRIYMDAGVNRISLGLQSFSPQILKSLGRSHDPGDIFPVIEAIGEVGFDNYSIDLIYGAAGESEAILEDTLCKVLSLSPAPVHVSAYALTVEAGTPLAKDTSRYPDEDYQASAYKLIDEMLLDAGMRWYEVSNWAKPGYYSRHNWNYWMQGEYVGLGCAAHSHLGSRRSWNVFNMGRYISFVRDGKDPVAGHEDITGELEISEALELLLRTSLGVPTESLADTEQIELLYADSNGIATLTLEGRLLANQVAMRLDPSKADPACITHLQRQAPWPME